MPRHIVVGYDDSDGAQDAAALGQRLARAAGRQLALVCVLAAGEEGDAGGVARPAPLAPLLSAIEPVVVRGASVAQGLISFAGPDADDAAAIVVGSPSRVPAGRIAVGTVAQSLLHGSPCAVALAPLGYAAGAAAGFSRIVVGYADSDESRAALRVAAGLGQAYGATVRVVFVTDGSSAHEELVRSLRRLAGLVETESLVLDGDPAERLLEQSRAWADLIVVGSRGYGPTRQVLLGSVSARLLAAADVPVIVTPRGAERELVELDGPAAGAGFADDEAVSL